MFETALTWFRFTEKQPPHGALVLVSNGHGYPDLKTYQRGELFDFYATERKPDNDEWWSIPVIPRAEEHPHDND